MQQGDGPDAMGKLFNNNERSDRQMKMPQRHGGRLSKPASTGSLPNSGTELWCVPNSGIDRNPKQSDNSTRFARQILIPVYCPGCQNLPHVMRSRVCLCA